jgi:hydrophobic/amphiphilic exporter-1 (mainly G- bacteria), HAE1 family
MTTRSPNGSNPVEEIPESGPRKMWLSDLSIRQPVFIAMVMAALILVGSIFYTRMPVDLLPDVSLPIVAVQTVYPGADPQQVEQAISRVIEDQVISINGVEGVRSSSLDSVSMVVIEFSMETDPKVAFDEVRARVESVRNRLPADAREPVIGKMDFSAAAALILAIADRTGQYAPEQLRAFADDIVKPRIERADGVATVDVAGGRVRQVNVELRADRLQAHSLSPQQVIQAIRSENLDIPGGRVVEGESEELLRTVGRVESMDQLGSISIATPRGAIVKLRELATISDSYADMRTISRLDGQTSVTAEVKKQSGTNVIQVVDAVYDELDTLRREYPDLEIGVAVDQSIFTRDAVHDVQIAMLLGGLLAGLVVLLFFRDIRNTLVTVVGLPIIVLGTFAVLHVIGITLNMVTLMALSLTIGILIDDAIVVRENIFLHMERGEEPRVAAGHGTAEIALAVVAITTTIMVVFAPIAFTGGMTGKFLREFGITVVVAVGISMIEAFTLAPMLSAYFFRRIPPARHAPGRRRGFRQLFAGVNSGYRRLLGWSLRHRFVVVVLSIAIFAGSAAIVPTMSQSFLPVIDQGEFGAVIELEPGARLADTDEAAREAERILMADPDVKQLFVSLGSSTGPVNRATLHIKLTSLGKTDEVIERVRPQLVAALPDATVRVQKQATTAYMVGASGMGAARGRPIQFAVEGRDLDLLQQVSDEIMARMNQVPGVTDVSSSLDEGRAQQLITIDRERAADLGISTAQVGSTIRTLVNGEVAGSYRSGDRDIDILVRLEEADRHSAERVLQIPILSSKAGVLPISSVASAVPSTEPTRIDRQDRQRQIIVGGGFTGRDMGPILAEAREAVAAIPVPEGVTVYLSGDAKYMDEAFEQLTFAILISVAFVYMILASQFGSFIHPFTIMLALPFSVAGALISLLIVGFSLDMLAMIGMILLMGLVAKNSILLVEFINQLRRRGLPTREAILEAGPIRLRPIMMTTLAMIFGMIPVAIGFGAGAELRQPMGVSVIGGLIASTMLTLVAVPVAYSLIDDLGQWIKRRFLGPPPALDIETETREPETVP